VILLLLVRREKVKKMGLELFVNRRLEVRFLSPAPDPVVPNGTAEDCTARRVKPLHYLHTD
jgi:hypothetical protein